MEDILFHRMNQHDRGEFETAIILGAFSNLRFYVLGISVVSEVVCLPSDSPPVMRAL